LVGPADLPGRNEARTGLRMMPTFPRSSLKFRKAGFPRYGFKAGMSGGAFPSTRGLRSSFTDHAGLRPCGTDSALPTPPTLRFSWRSQFSRLNYGSHSLQPADLLAPLSEQTKLSPSLRGLLHPGFRRIGHQLATATRTPRWKRSAPLSEISLPSRNHTSRPRRPAGSMAAAPFVLGEVSLCGRMGWAIGA